MFVEFGHPAPERSHSLLASTKCQRHMRWAPAKATPKRVTLTCGWWKRSTSFQSAVSGEMTSRTETPVVFTDLWLDSLCVCACGHVCTYVCVCKYIVYVCVQLYLHMKIPRIRHICRRHPLKNLHTMDIGSVYIHLLPKDLLGSTRSPGRVLQSIDQIPSFFSDMRLAKDCYT